MRSRLLLFVFVLIIAVSCAHTSTKPEWVSKGSGAFQEKSFTKLYGMGVYGSTPNTAVQIEGARTRARAELAAQLKITVQRLGKDFVEEQKDWFDIGNTATSDEFFSSMGKQVVDQVLIGSKQIDSWEDPKTGDLYMLYSIDLNDKFYEAYKQSLSRAMAEKHNEIMKIKVEEAMGELDEEVKKQREREFEILGIPKN